MFNTSNSNVAPIETKNENSLNSTNAIITDNSNDNPELPSKFSDPSVMNAKVQELLLSKVKPLVED